MSRFIISTQREDFTSHVEAKPFLIELEGLALVLQRCVLRLPCLPSAGECGHF